MTKLEKFLSKLTKKKRPVIEHTIMRIVQNDLKGLDVKKLKNIDYLYRVRKGGIRIIFSLENNVANIIEICWRNDNTYK